MRRVPVIMVAGLLLGGCGGGGALAPSEAAVRYYRMASADLAGDFTTEGLDDLAVAEMFEQVWGEKGYTCHNEEDSGDFYWVIVASTSDSLLNAIALEVAFCPQRSAADLAEEIKERNPVPPPLPWDLRERISELIDVAG